MWTEQEECPCLKIWKNWEMEPVPTGLAAGGCACVMFVSLSDQLPSTNSEQCQPSSAEMQWGHMGEGKEELRKTVLKGP